jgi:DNA-directed RNA polymerase specialized sigma subunit
LDNVFYKGSTLQETGDVLGITRQRVEQIKKEMFWFLKQMPWVQEVKNAFI